MSLLKFYFTPGACSIGIHILLQELDLLFEAYPVNLLKGDTQKPEFLAMNPKGTIPVLVLKGGKPLTDFVSIAWWLAREFPQAGWLPEDPMAEIHELEKINYCVNTLHGQGFTRIFTPERYNADSMDHPLIKASGETLVKRGLQHYERLLETDELFEQKPFSLADAGFFYNAFWAERSGIALPERCAMRYRQLLQRPAVQQVLMEEGYHTTAKQAFMPTASLESTEYASA